MNWNPMTWFRNKQKPVKRVKHKKLVVDNSQAFGNDLKRMIGPVTSRLDDDFQQNLIRTATINNDIRTSGDNLRAMSRTISINTPMGKRAVQYQVDNVIGEVFIQIHETPVDFKISIIESARCKFGDREQTEDGYILDGIEYDQDDCPIRYWFSEIDAMTQTEKGGSYSVPANEIIHYYRELFPDQRRGIPEAVANIDTMNQYNAFTFSTLVQKRAAASSMGFITQDKDSQENLDLGLEDNEGDYVEPDIIQEFEAGTINKLPAGYDIKQFSSTQGGDDFLNFTERLEDHLSMGYGFYKQGWKGDTSNINYSAARFGDQAQRVMFKSVQRNLKEQVFEAIFERWLQWMILNEELPIRMTGVNSVMLQITWTFPKWESIDPLKDTQKDVMDVENGFKSAADVIISRSEDPESVFSQIEQERTRYVPKYDNQIKVASAPAELAGEAQIEVAEINSDNTSE